MNKTNATTSVKRKLVSTGSVAALAVTGMVGLSVTNLASASAEPVTAPAAVSLHCEPGGVYVALSGGQIKYITPDHQVTDGLPTVALEPNDPNAKRYTTADHALNGLGIGKDGESVYALDRSAVSLVKAPDDSKKYDIWYARQFAGAQVQVKKLDLGTGKWSNVGQPVLSARFKDNLPDNRELNAHPEKYLDLEKQVTFVDGAVSLENGNYYFGGFDLTGQHARIWELNAGTNDIRFVGDLNTGERATRANGDFAFDENGNLFIVKGDQGATSVYTISKASLDSANGGTLTASSSNKVQTIPDINGVAFDADGKAFLSSETQIKSFEMPGLSNGTEIVTQPNVAGRDAFTDLASCGPAPATITLRKDVEGQRYSVDDQFTIKLNQGDTEVAEATTSGHNVGVQPEQIGPLPTKRGVTLSFFENGVNQANLDNYNSSYKCEVDGQPIEGASGSSTSGSVTIPSKGKDVVCTLTNSAKPLPAPTDTVTPEPTQTGIETPTETSTPEFTPSVTATPSVSPKPKASVSPSVASSRPPQNSSSKLAFTGSDVAVPAIVAGAMLIMGAVLLLRRKNVD